MPTGREQAETDARAYVERAISSFDSDSPDTQFQKGFLAALKVVRDEAFAEIVDAAPDAK